MLYSWVEQHSFCLLLLSTLTAWPMPKSETKSETPPLKFSVVVGEEIPNEPCQSVHISWCTWGISRFLRTGAFLFFDRVTTPDTPLDHNQAHVVHNHLFGSTRWQMPAENVNNSSCAVAYHSAGAGFFVGTQHCSISVSLQHVVVATFSTWMALSFPLHTIR